MVQDRFNEWLVVQHGLRLRGWISADLSCQLAAGLSIPATANLLSSRHLCLDKLIQLSNYSSVFAHLFFIVANCWEQEP
jgi:hypothetical protein